MKKNLILILGLFISTNALIAQNLNDYKYVTVPNTYEFLKIADKYQLNSLTKFLLKKEGFIALFKDEKKPKDFYDNPCLGLTINVLKKSSFLNTALMFELENCKNEIVFSSKKGSSKLKEYKPAYHAALRNAFKSIKIENYSYNNSAISNVVVVKPKVVATTTPKTTVKNHPKIVTNSPNATITLEIKKKATKMVDSSKEKTNTVELKEVLYAQRTSNGFQLVNNKPEIKYVLLNSGKKDVLNCIDFMQDSTSLSVHV